MTVGEAASPEGAVESMTDPESIIRRLFALVDAGGDDFVDEFYSPEYVDHTPSSVRSLAPGREGLRQAFAIFRRGFPDVRHVLEDVIAAGDRVAVRLRAEGTHSGELFGIPASGQRVSQEAIVIYRLAGGKIVERWSMSSPDLMEEVRRLASGRTTTAVANDHRR